MPPRAKPAAESAAESATATKGAAKALSAPQQALIKLGLSRPIDLALHIPIRYEDETRIGTLGSARDGDVVQVVAEVVRNEVQIRGRRQLLVTVNDGTDTCVLRFFTFYPNTQRALAVGTRWRIRGEVRGGFGGLTMMHPSFKPVDAPLPTALTPVYASSAALPQSYLRKAVDAALVRLTWPETVPSACWDDLLNETGLQPSRDIKSSLSFLHHPSPDVTLSQLADKTHPAWIRLKAEELLAQQLSQAQAKQARAELRAPLFAAAAGGVRDQLLATLPFALTRAQQRVVGEIAQDLARPATGAAPHGLGAVPMHRLLQGDVGSGKTVVAALAAAIAIDAGWQGALMVPTEILATQHAAKLVAWLTPLLAPRGKRVAWLLGSQKKRERTEMLAAIASGEAALVVGTHAVIQEQVQFHRLALAIVDEQHRFGVAQRLALRAKMKHGLEENPAHALVDIENPATKTEANGVVRGDVQHAPPDVQHAPPGTPEPHLLMMSATPIPRTLAMSYYADLDVSTLDELPPGRTPIVTKLVADARRDEVVARIHAQVQAGRQVYWVCPLIEESEKVDLINATATHAALCEALPELGAARIGLVHSRMAAADKAEVMGRFVRGDLAVLVSTTVIEVGVDVPNASLMVIEHAERFGLSQLHQLRGRVGRGTAASACVLLYSLGEHGRLSDTARERLRAMVETQDGFEIARRDLAIRGPGEFLGARQSGTPLLRFADLEEDAALLAWASHTAPRLLAEHPDLADQHVQRWLGGQVDYIKA